MISIVIPTCNRPDMLINCIDGLSYSSQELSANEYEIIITDDSSDLKTKELIENKYPDVSYFAGPRKGPAANRNSGASHARGEFIMFIDDDCLPDSNIVREYLKAIATNKDVEVFEGCIKADRPKQHFLEESPINLTGGYMWSCNIMLKKTFFNELKGFDEDFPFAAMEDVDLHTRVKKAGKKIYFVAKAFVIHPWRLQEKILDITAKRAKSEDYYYTKHPDLFFNKYTFKNRLRFFYKLIKNYSKFKGQGAMLFIKAHNLEWQKGKERLKKMNR